MSAAKGSPSLPSDADAFPNADLFAGRNVVVTGGTGFLGSAVVERLLAAGATCHIPALAEKEVARFPHRDHERVHLSYPVDLGREDEVVAFFEKVGPLWASIHCAGGFAMADLAETTFDAWRKQQSGNLDSCFLCCREALKAIRRGGQKGGGRIVNVTARPALEPRLGGGLVAYTVAKAGVAALTQALAEELAAEGIWVNAVVPSTIDTPANRAAMADADFSLWPKPNELAETLVFLASPSNRATRGGLVPVYGRS